MWKGGNESKIGRSVFHRALGLLSWILVTIMIWVAKAGRPRKPPS